MTHSDIIARLGGPKTVADFLGIANPNTVTYWGRWQEGRAIPARHWGALATMKPEEVTLADFAAGLAEGLRLRDAAAKAEAA